MNDRYKSTSSSGEPEHESDPLGPPSWPAPASTVIGSSAVALGILAFAGAVAFGAEWLASLFTDDYGNRALAALAGSALAVIILLVLFPWLQRPPLK